jgi:MFS family permease
MLPLDLFRVRVIAVASMGGFLMGTILYCAAAFVPMFAQGVLGGSAIDAGMTLAPMSIGWPIASTTSGLLLMRFGYRPFIILGAGFGVVGCLLLSGVHAEAGRGPVMGAMLCVGLGLGFLSTPYLLAVQNAVPLSRRGVATSSVQFFRSIGGAIAVAALGAVLNAGISSRLGEGADLNIALDPVSRTLIPEAALGPMVAALESGLEVIYLAMAGLAFLGFLVAALFPRGSAESHAHAEAR